MIFKPGGWRMPGFLKLIQCRRLYVCVFVCVCLPLRLLITCGVILTLYDWLTKFYSCYVATVVGIVDGRGICVVETSPIRIS